MDNFCFKCSVVHCHLIACPFAHLLSYMTAAVFRVNNWIQFRLTYFNIFFHSWSLFLVSTLSGYRQRSNWRATKNVATIRVFSRYLSRKWHCAVRRVYYWIASDLTDLSVQQITFWKAERKFGWFFVASKIPYRLLPTTSFYHQYKMKQNRWLRNWRKSCLIEMPFSRFLKRAGRRSLNLIWRHFLLDYSDTQILNILLRLLDRPRLDFQPLLSPRLTLDPHWEEDKQLNSQNGWNSSPVSPLLVLYWTRKNTTGDNVLFKNLYLLG